MGRLTDAVVVAVLGCAILAPGLVSGPAVAGGPSALGPRVVGPAAATAALPDTIEGFASYEGQTLCDPSPLPGTRRLADLMRRRFGDAPMGLSRDCSIGGISEHKEGRAIDWMVSVRDPRGRDRARDFLDWLLAPDAAGNSAAMARRLGVMYIGWNNRIWRSYDDGSWGDLHGCLDNPRKRGPAYDSTCHRNHIHVSLSWDGATARTSYWTGRVLPDACPTGDWLEVPEVLVPAGSPTTVLDTATGTGTPGALPCRVSAGGWSGDPLRIRLVDPAAPVEPDPVPSEEPWGDDTWPDEPPTDDPGPDDPWTQEPVPGDPWTDDPVGGSDPSATAAGRTRSPAAGAPTAVGGITVRLRIQRLSGNAPAAIRLGTGADAVRLDLPAARGREVTVGVGVDRVLAVRVTRGLAEVRLTALAVEQAP